MGSNCSFSTGGSQGCRDRLELLAFDARLAGVPPGLVEALWEAIDLVETLARHRENRLER
jgi:hypothetical protein